LNGWIAKRRLLNLCRDIVLSDTHQSNRFAYRRPAKRSPLFHPAAIRSPRLLVQCFAVNL